MSSSDDDDDEYIIHGQLLDPIQEDEIVKRKDAEQQFVRDENGRKRFHGAFTGGFSAGFFNTVGSQEGWTPSTFKSSRNLKSTLKPQNAYDFMDEEDKKELGIDSSSLKIKAEYSGQSSRKRQCPEINTGPIPGKPVLGEILKPTTDTWGVELLKSMGWRPGQGIGPHLTQREKLRTKKELENVGMKFKTNTKYEDNDVEINELLDNFKVSPYEYESVAIKPKTDIFGLGYESIKSSNVPIKSMEKVYSKLTVGGKSIHGQAFGVGAYEDDDEDIYSTDNMSNYDFSLDDKNQNSKKKSKYNTLDSECIDGFVKDDVKHGFFEKLPSSAKIPPEWRPQGMFERILGQSAPDLFIKPTGQFNVNVNSRQRIMKKIEQPLLDEESIKKEVHSLLPDILSDRFTKAVLPDESTNALIPVVRTCDPELQKLKDYADQKFFGFWTRKTEPWVPDKLLCKRFNVPVPKQAIVYTNDGKKKGECSLFSSLEFTSQEPKSVEHQTLNTVSLVNDNANTENNDNANTENNDNASTENNDNASTENNDNANTENNDNANIENNEKHDYSENVKDVTAQHIVQNQKPSVDFFKDIFLDTSDDEMPEVQQSLKNENIPRNSNEKDVCSTEISSVKKETVESNVQSAKPFNMFPPKGIFANLNFDDLFNSPDNNTTNKNNISSKNETDNINKQYGPLLPEKNNIQFRSINLKNIKSVSSDDEWVEKIELSTKKETSHKKKHSKSKKSKHKKKSKKKSHKHK